MNQLPVLLEPWRAWLTLLPDDLVEPLGSFLLRVNPQIGPLRSAPARADALPEGVGSIVQRGPYERLLISEWAIADAEPDEFLRRAANGELMFAGPEPAARQRSRRCLALFDAGPAQLGEPRLLHLALFILLARRAEEAGAVFEWGILQDPVTLRRDSGRHGIQKLLKARRLDAVDATALAAWSATLDSATDDAWVIGARGAQALAGVRGTVAIGRDLLADRLDVVVRLHQSVRQFTLDLPAADLAIRLLRSPFVPLASKAHVSAAGRPSLLLAPRFAVSSSMLAVPQLDGGIVVYAVPTSLKNKPGKARRQAAPGKGTILGAGIFRKNLGQLISEGDTLRFKDFPSEGFASKFAVTPRPQPEDFRAPPQRARWLAVFFLTHGVARTQQTTRAMHNQVLALDVDGKLVAWRRTSTTQSGTTTVSDMRFCSVATDVVGAEQSESRLLYATSTDSTTTIYCLALENTVLVKLPYRTDRILFGAVRTWSHQVGHGLIALRLSDTEWWVGVHGEMARIEINDGARVIGVVASDKDGKHALVVLTKQKRIIEVRSSAAVRVLVRCAEDIAQASVCPNSGNVAWVGARSHRISVQGIDEDRPYLEVAPEGDEYDA